MSRDFDGSTMWGEATSIPTLSYPFTLSCLFHGQTATQDGTCIAFSDGAVGDNNLYIGPSTQGSGPRRFALNLSSGSSEEIYSASAYSQNTWHNGVGVFISSTSRFVYLDDDSGTEGTTDLSLPAGIDSFDIAKLSWGGSDVNQFNGLLAECAGWSIELTAAHITELALGASPLMIAPEFLIFYHPLNSGNSPEVDVINGHDMTLTASPPQAGHPPVYYDFTSPFAPSVPSAAPAVPFGYELNDSFYIPRQKTIFIPE